MKVSTILIVIFMLMAVAGFGQAGSKDKFTDPVGEPDANKIGADKPLELTQVTVTDCEEAGYWYTEMAQEEGMITIKTLRGNPKEKELKDAARLEDERKIRKDDKWLGDYVIGARVTFYRRGANEFTIRPVKPIPIAGTTKIISAWVVGRNYNHELKVIIADFYGNRGELSMGKLNFSGWKKMSVAVPPRITQSDLHYTNKEGLKFLGFKVVCNIDESFGTYYLYLDDVAVETDLFSMQTRDRDDMNDGW
jgi:hypothetical protein